MSHLTKQDILNEIRRTARENDGKPLGIARFEKETRIKIYEWKKYWPRFGDAQKEAGFPPNLLQGAYDDEFIFEKVIGVMRKLERFPTLDELRIERNLDSEFPSRNVFIKFGSKQERAKRILQYATNRKGYEDIIVLCEPALERSSKKESSDDRNTSVGEVYLFKSGRYYKIGKTTDTVRRGKEIRIQLPERTDLIHAIKTDDPSGVEAYWHKRFEAKRMQGEWFNLSSSDIKAFKRWRKIV
ncbi:MAG TPA: GIY-YIG nuclease family protein [Candidatus Avalokitesvara rifleensis]|uniref:GIY-YIG nuclease family protein n=1 Tax=Candidatus Avalokitesvara rifleensis TaxID=3367620 RepID=UPI00402A4A8E